MIRCALKGNAGNVMFVYLTALKLRQALGTGRIVGVNLPMWQIDIAEEYKTGKSTMHFPRPLEARTRGRVPVEAIRSYARDHRIEQIELEGFCQPAANLPDRHSIDFRLMFDGRESGAAGYGDDTLLISIRGNEILGAVHPDYTLLPAQFYAELAESTGLRPVVFGQIADNPYVDELRRVLPGAVFQPGRNPLHDFEVIRRSRNIVVSVSTFAWLAAWLSDASRIILPVSGLFHPNQHKSTCLIPHGDPRYEYYLFPINRAVPVHLFQAAHRPMAGRWRRISDAMLREMFEGAPRHPVRLGKYLEAFDAQSYVEAYPDQQHNRAAHGDNAVFDHFMAEGFWSGRAPFRIDPHWYCQTYPDAAWEIGQHDFIDEAHHFVEIGRERGYRRHAP